MAGAKLWHKVLLIVLGVWMLALFAPLMVTLAKEWSAARGRFDQFASALVAQRYEEAYSFCGTGFQEATTFDVFVEQQKVLQRRHGSLKAVLRKGTTVSIKESEADWTTVIKADFQFERATRRFVFELHHEGGQWVVFGYKELGS